MSFVSGMRIGKYELGKKLGEGGFGLVFRARDVDLDRDVALKFMHPEHTANADILRRFLQEARAAAKIVHPGIVTVFECGQLPDNNVAYIAMELLSGESLTDRLARERQLAPRVAIDITRQVASALEAAHAAGIIHRDLKPDNIYICRDPAMPTGERMKVLDFGIAKLAQAPGSGMQTRTHVLMGTPVYMSPEQCRSAAHIDARSDIYTLGCILFELVCGKPPFDGEMGELIAKHQMSPAPSARSMRPDVPAGLDALIASMLAKNPDERPQTMGAVQQQLAACADGRASTPLPVIPAAHDSATIHASTVPAHPTTLGGAAAQAVTVPPAKKSGGKLAVIGVLVAAVAGGGIFMATRGKTEPPPVAAAPPPAVVEVPPAPEPVKPIKLELDANPVAEVYAFDGRLLGKTPYATERAPAEGKVVFLLKAEGYQDQRVEMRADQSEATKVDLVKVAAAQPVKPTTVAKPKPVAKPAAEKPKRPATPLKPGDIVID